MAVVIPPTVADLPLAPDPADRSTFNARAYPWSVALGPFSTQLQAVATNVYNNSLEAFNWGTIANTKAAEAAASAILAAAAATSAINAPGTFATSSSSLTLSAGTKVFILNQTGKLYNPGQRLVFARTSDPTGKRMVAYLATFDQSTGAGTATVGASDFIGTGTYTDWTISLAGEGNNLPVPVGGDVGKVVGVVGAGQYGLVTARGAGAATFSGNTTLVAADLIATAMIRITGTNQIAQWVQLPSALTLSPGVGIAAINNACPVDLEIRDGAGTAIGFAKPNTTVYVSLSSNASIAGTWALTGASFFSVMNVPFTSGSGSNLILESVTPVDSGRDLILVSTASAVYAVVWDSVNCVLGTPVMVRASAPNPGTGKTNCRSVKLATDSMFVGTHNVTSLQGVVLTLTGTTIAAGTVVTYAGVSWQFIEDMIAVAGVGVAFSMLSNTPSHSYIVATVTGTVVVFGTPITPNGNATIAAEVPRPLFDLGGGRILAFYTVASTTNLAAIAYSISGGVLTGGTPYTMTGLSFYNSTIRLLPTGRWAVIGVNSTTVTGYLFSVSGTTITGASGSGGTLYTSNYIHACHVIGNQVLVASANSSASTYVANVMTDNAGTAVFGTSLSRTTHSGTPTTQAQLLSADTSGVTLFRNESGTSGIGNGTVIRFGISGNNPVLFSARPVTSPDFFGPSSGPGGTPSPVTSPNNYAGGTIYGKESFPVGGVQGNQAALDFSNTRAVAWLTVGSTTELVPRPMMYESLPNNTYTNNRARGADNSTQWFSGTGASGPLTTVLQRIKVV